MSSAASRAPSRDDEWLTWPLRPFRAYQGSPMLLGLITLGGYLVAAAAIDFWTLSSDLILGPLGSRLVTSELLYGLTLAYAPVALVYSRRGAERDLLLLAPLLAGGVEAARRQLFAPSPRSLAAAIPVALCVAGVDLWAILVLNDVRPPRSVIPWFVFRELLGDLAVFWVLAWMVTVSLRMSALAPGPERIRLLATDQLAPFGQHGVRLALFWLLLWAVWAPALFITEGDFFAAMLTMLLIGASFSGIGAWLPVRGVQASIRTARRAELASVRDAIEQARAGALVPGGEAAQPSAARLPGLLAYEARIAGVSETLIDVGTLRRIGLYLLIPLASWVGGALVERLVDAALE